MDKRINTIMKPTTKKSTIQDTETTIVYLPWRKRLWQWWISLFKEEYELIVWFHSETIIQEDGVKTIRRMRKEFQLKDITKKSPTHIVGKDIFGKPFEIKTVEPFDYQIRKIL